MAAFIAEKSKDGLLQAAIEAESQPVARTSTATETVAAAKVGHRAALIALDIVDAGGSNTFQVSYGSSPTAITGAIPITSGGQFQINPNDCNPVIGPENEDLKVVWTIGGTSLTGHYKVAYIPVD